MISQLFFIVPILVSFIATLFILPLWIKKAKKIGLIWKDMNKFEERNVAGSGGVIVVTGFVLGVLIYMAYRTFILRDGDSILIESLALLVSVLFMSGVGFIDDLLGWQKGGMSRRSRIILIAVAAIPFMAINAGSGLVSFPILGSVNLGIIYPLILIPLGIVGAATTYNFLAGYNGLEAGQGIIILSSIALVAYFTGSSWIAVISLCMVAALFAFMIYNFYPAKVFPGDSITLTIGGLIAIFAILGNFEKIAVFFFIPYIIETFLKARGKLVKHSFGFPKEDGSLGLRYNKIYGLEHLSIYLFEKAGIKPTEKKVVYSIWLFQIIIVILGLLIFKGGIFR